VRFIVKRNEECSISVMPNRPEKRAHQLCFFPDMLVSTTARADIEEEPDGQRFVCARRERLDLLLDLVFEKMKIAGLEVGDGLAVFVEGDQIQSDECRRPGTSRRNPGCVRIGGRLLRRRYRAKPSKQNSGIKRKRKCQFVILVIPLERSSLCGRALSGRG
jgi:hypothetical protein